MSESTLRQEARDIPLRDLTASQREGLGELLTFLESAVKHSNQSVETRESRLLLLSGTRGAGKTSLVLTVREKLSQFKRSTDRRDRDWRDDDDSGQKSKDEKQKSHEPEELEARLRKLAHDVHWLETLSLDPMHRGTNLLAAILARISARAERPDGSKPVERGLFDPTTVLDRARHELMNLRTEAVSALEGNLEERAQGLDPESYSTAANEAERQKLHLPEQLNRILGHIAAGPDAPERDKHLFVLPIDDVDIRPSRAIEVLKLAYSLSIPRLFFVFMGSAKVLDQVLFYQMQGEFAGLLGSEAERNQKVTADIEASANEIASSLLRKLIPPGQRIKLANMDLGEALAYPTASRQADDKGKQGGARDDDLEGLLGRVTFRPHAVCTHEVSSTMDDLKSFIVCPIEAAGDGAKAGRARSSPYDGAGLLRGSPRQVADLHQLFDAFTKLDGKALSPLLKKLTENFCTLVDEDAALTVPVQDRLKVVVSEVHGSDGASKTWHLDTSGLRVTSATWNPLDFCLRDLDKFAINGAGVHGRRIRRHDVEAMDDEGRPRPLLPQTRSSLELLHDLLLLSDEGRVSAAIPYANDREIAFTTWDDGDSDPMQIPWRCAHWGSFWHLDVFTAHWNQGLEGIHQALVEPACLDDGAFAPLLGLNWVQAVVRTLRAVPGRQCRGDVLVEKASDKKDAPWRLGDIHATAAALAVELADLAQYVTDKREKGQDDQEADLVDELLVELACLAMPEIGLIRLNVVGTPGDTANDGGVTTLARTFDSKVIDLARRERAAWRAKENALRAQERARKEGVAKKETEASEAHGEAAKDHTEAREALKSACATALPRPADKKPEQGEYARTVVDCLLRHILEIERVKTKLAPQVCARRLARIGPYIRTILGVSFVRPREHGPQAPTESMPLLAPANPLPDEYWPKPKQVQAFFRRQSRLPLSPGISQHHVGDVQELLELVN